MGIYIPGMEMPSCCMFCPISNSSGCGMTNPPILMTSKEMLADRPDWCPLVPVPPHGRLINADARVNVQMYNDEFEDFQTVNMSIDDLLDSSWIELEDDPTIIPAEPAKEAQP